MFRKRNVVVLIFVLTLFGVAAVILGIAKNAAMDEIRLHTMQEAKVRAFELENELRKFQLLPNLLAENLLVHNALENNSSDLILSLNQRLSSFEALTGAAYIYLTDTQGRVIASSNFAEQDNFIGGSFSFRPYYQEAMVDGYAKHFAKGLKTGVAGLFFSRRVDNKGVPIGVIVVKVEFGDLIQRWEELNTTTVVVNNEQIALFSTDSTLNYTLLSPLDEKRQKEIVESKQFGEAKLPASWLKLDQDLRGTDLQQNPLQAAKVSIDGISWELILIEQISPKLNIALTKALVLILFFGIIIVVSATYLSWRIARDKERRLATQRLQTEVTRKTKKLIEANNLLKDEGNKREEINKRFRMAREELAQANRLGSIGIITASVAHEINQPVAAIKAFSQNGIKFIQRSEYREVEQNLNSVVRLTDKIGAITNELRQYARRSGNTLGRVSVVDVLDGVDLLMSDVVKGAGIKYRVKIDNYNNLEVKADRVRLEQVIVNLLQNAVDALKDTESPKIMLMVVQIESITQITIDDNGHGVSKDIADNLFTPFVTNKAKGLGIGLGIARDIVKEFGGDLSLIRSDLGGASFQIKLINYDKY